MSGQNATLRVNLLVSQYFHEARASRSFGFDARRRNLVLLRRANYRYLRSGIQNRGFLRCRVVCVCPRYEGPPTCKRRRASKKGGEVVAGLDVVRPGWSSAPGEDRAPADADGIRFRLETYFSLGLHDRSPHQPPDCRIRHGRSRARSRPDPRAPRSGVQSSSPRAEPRQFRDHVACCAVASVPSSPRFAWAGSRAVGTRARSIHR